MYFTQPLTMKIEALFGGLTTLILAVIGWAFSINSRVNVTQQQNIDMKDLIEAKFETAFQRFDGFDTRLERVERHVLNGHYGDK